MTCLGVCGAIVSKQCENTRNDGDPKGNVGNPTGVEDFLIEGGYSDGFCVFPKGAYKSGHDAAFRGGIKYRHCKRVRAMQSTKN